MGLGTFAYLGKDEGADVDPAKAALTPEEQATILTTWEKASTEKGAGASDAAVPASVTMAPALPSGVLKVVLLGSAAIGAAYIVGRRLLKGGRRRGGRRRRR